MILQYCQIRLTCLIIRVLYYYCYYKVSYIKYRNIHKQCTTQTTWRVQKVRTVQLGAANRHIEVIIEVIMVIIVS